jgi:hypothetical protein
MTYTPPSHGIHTGDIVRVGKGTKKWYVEAAYEKRVTITHMVRRGYQQAWTEMRRYLTTPEQIATLTKLDEEART